MLLNLKALLSSLIQHIPYFYKETFTKQLHSIIQYCSLQDTVLYSFIIFKKFRPTNYALLIICYITTLFIFLIIFGDPADLSKKNLLYALLMIIHFTFISIYVYNTINIQSLGNEVTLYLCRTIKTTSYHPLSEDKSFPTYCWTTFFIHFKKGISFEQFVNI